MQLRLRSDHCKDHCKEGAASWRKDAPVFARRGLGPGVRTPLGSGPRISHGAPGLGHAIVRGHSGCSCREELAVGQGDELLVEEELCHKFEDCQEPEDARKGDYRISAECYSYVRFTGEGLLVPVRVRNMFTKIHGVFAHPPDVIKAAKGGRCDGCAWASLPPVFAEGQLWGPSKLQLKDT